MASKITMFRSLNRAEQLYNTGVLSHVDVQILKHSLYGYSRSCDVNFKGRWNQYDECQNKESLKGSVLHFVTLNEKRYDLFENLEDLIDIPDVDINLRDSNGQTPLSLAVINRYTTSSNRSVEELIDRGSKVNLVDNNGNTLLHHICSGVQLNDTYCLIELILRSGGNVHEKNNDGYDVLKVAQLYGNSKKVKLLLNYGGV